MPEKHGAAEHDVSHYPHFQGDGEVTHDQLAQHMEGHPELYENGLREIALGHLAKARTSDMGVATENPDVADVLHDEWEFSDDPAVRLKGLKSQLEKADALASEEGERRGFAYTDFYDITTDDALLLIENNYAHGLVQHLSEMHLDESVAKALCEHGYQFSVAQNLASFDIHDNDLILGFIRSGYVDDVVANLYRMGDLDERVQDELMRKGFTDEVVEHSYSFRSFSVTERMIDELIEKGAGDALYELDKHLDSAQRQQVIRRVLGSRDLESYGFYLSSVLHSVTDLTLEDATRLIRHGLSYLMIENVDGAFASLDKRELINLLDDEGMRAQSEMLKAHMERYDFSLDDLLEQIRNSRFMMIPYEQLNRLSTDDLIRLPLELGDDMTRATWWRIVNTAEARGPAVMQRLLVSMIDVDPARVVDSASSYPGGLPAIYGMFKEAGKELKIVEHADVYDLRQIMQAQELDELYLRAVQAGDIDVFKVYNFFSHRHGATRLLSNDFLEALAADSRYVAMPVINKKHFEPFDVSKYIIEASQRGSLDTQNISQILTGQVHLSKECFDILSSNHPMEALMGKLTAFDGVDPHEAFDRFMENTEDEKVVADVLDECLWDAAYGNEQYAEHIMRWVTGTEQRSARLLPTLNESLVNMLEEKRIPVVLHDTESLVQALLDEYTEMSDIRRYGAGSEQWPFFDEQYEAARYTERLNVYVKLQSLSPDSDPLPRYLTMFKDEVGSVPEIQILCMLREIMDADTVPVEAELYGVDEAGEAGLVKLVERIKTMSTEFKNVELTDGQEQLLATSSAARRAFLSVTEISKTEGYGNRSEAALLKKVGYMLHARKEGLIRPMHEAFVPSETYEIETASSKKEKPVWSEDVLSKYDSLRAELSYAEKQSSTPGGFQEIIEGLRSEIAEVVEKIDRAMADIDDSHPNAPFKRKNLIQRKEELNRYLAEVDNGEQVNKRFIMNSPVDFQRGFSIMEKYPELHPGMRQLTFAWALRKHPEQRAAIASLNPVEPDVTDIVSVREFVDKIVHERTYGDYFTDKRIAQKFRQMTSVRSLSDALVRHNDHIKKTRTTGIQFIPTRGIYMEVSGQIGNACWADIHDSNAEKMPNMTALIMKARPGEKHERIVGAAMLIESRDEYTGEDVLILRGTNPTENYINKVDVDDFYQAITDYVKKMAAKMGRKPAVVVDNHSGGSATNRPVLFDNLRERSVSMKRVHVPEEETTFNGYDITRDTFAIE